jgi:hypothetical protein
MTKQQEWLTRACEFLGIGIDLDFKLRCADDHEIESVARIRGVGMPNGMLVIRSFDAVRKYQEYLEVAGYGYSVLTGPGDQETFDLEGYREMFCEWGWPEGECAEIGEETDAE